MFLVTLGLLLAAIFIIHQYIYGYWKRRGIPYIKPHLIYGNLKGFVNRNESFALSAANLYYKSEEPAVGVYLFFRPAILIRDADLAKKVLVTDFQNFYDRGVHSNEESSPVSANLFSLEGKNWKDLRANLTPTFTSGKLKKMMPEIELVGNRMEEYLENLIESGHSIIDMDEVATKYTNDVIVSIFFGLDVDSFKDNANIFAQCRDQINSKDFMINLTMATVFLYPKLFDFLKLYRFSNKFMNMMGDIIQKTIQNREENNIQRNDFLQMLMQLQKTGELEGEENGKKVKLTMNQIVAQTLLFFIAGSDTTAITIACCLHELTQNEEVMQKLKEDINKALEKHNGVICYDSIQEMEYLDMVIQEAARKYPALPVLNRKCTKPFKIPNSDIVIEEDTQLIISILGFHRDPKYFPDPMKFEPERFREGSERYNANAYIPFGDGPRTCIGMRQAKISAKVAVVRLLTKFQLTALEKREIVFDNYATSLKAKGGIKLKISKNIH
ncbi:probable cytochrome P450 6d5 isoform X2 [Hermetia illucens]|uniref:probable cytochrome P450 6d5 isoform X2 n=1 Tax=Hermetia illucens TaxID=343691 RepID=UPI0018CC25A9|nr:probable cytochrome P450 6d5 isoform X2 [Hermetia illucens]